jgi:sugar diacid utilization regulator
MTSVPPATIAAVARAAAADAGGLDVGLLGDYLEIVVDAAATGRRLRREELDRSREHGMRAAEDAVALRALMDLYLSAAWRLWRHLPEVRASASTAGPAGAAAVVAAGEAMLRAVDDAVAALADGYQGARRRLGREQEGARRRFLDDLLEGGAVSEVLEQAPAFGVTLTGPHVVAVAAQATAQAAMKATAQATTQATAQAPASTAASALALGDGSPLVRDLERSLHEADLDVESLVTARAGQLVVIFAASPAGGAQVQQQVLRRVTAALGGGSGWQIGVGRAASGPVGIRMSYDEARDALDLARRLGLTAPVVAAADLLVYTVLLRDRAAVVELITSLLTPLTQARGGARPLLDTLSAYFAAGGNAAAAARALHLSVRALTYRLERIAALTGRDPTDPQERFALQAATLGAQLLGWPERDLTV